MSIVYDNRCQACEHSFESKQSMMDSPLKTCPLCGKDEVRRILHPPALAIRQPITTIGQQADHNLRRMGHYERDDQRHEQQQAKEKAAAAVGRPKAARPWWRKTDKPNLELAKLAPKMTIKNGKVVDREPLSPEAERYIMTGK